MCGALPAFALALCLGLADAAAAPPEVPGPMSASSLGLAGAGAAAMAADPLALADNPASLAQFDRPALALAGAPGIDGRGRAVAGAAVVPLGQRLRLGLAAGRAEHDGGGNVGGNVAALPALGIVAAPSLALGVGAVVQGDDAGISLGAQWQPTSTARAGFSYRQGLGDGPHVVSLGGVRDLWPGLALHGGLTWRHADGRDALDAAAGLEWRPRLAWALRAGLSVDGFAPDGAALAAGLSWRPAPQVELAAAWQAQVGGGQARDRALFQLTLRF